MQGISFNLVYFSSSPTKKNMQLQWILCPTPKPPIPTEPHFEGEGEEWAKTRVLRNK